MLEGYTSLGFVAAQTQRVQLGLLVSGVTYRYPGLLAKTVTTLDVLSGGRALLGIGAAWCEREHLGLGVPFPSVAERFERLEEALQVCKQMWSSDEGPYDGKHSQLAETICSPAPDPETVAHKLDVLARHCADVGRDPATVEKTIIGQWDPFDPGFLPAMQAYSALGVEQVALTPMTEDPAGWVTQVCEQVLPPLAEL